MKFITSLQIDEFEEVLRFLSNLDLVDEDLMPEIEEIFKCLESELLTEVRRKRVIRGGKRVMKLFCPPRMMVKGRRCVMIPAKRRTMMKRIARRTARKRKAKRAQIRRKMKRARLRRKAMGL